MKNNVSYYDEIIYKKCFNYNMGVYSKQQTI